MYTVPTGAPHSLNAVTIDSSSLNLFWEEPRADKQNGEIIHYHIALVTFDTGEKLHIRTENANTSLRVQSLHPFFTYQFTVAASTVVGTGPYSPGYQLQMPEDGEEVTTEL